VFHEVRAEIPGEDDFEDVGLNVYQVDRTRVSTSNQALEELAGHSNIKQ